MSIRLQGRAIIAVLALAASLFAGEARAANWLELNFWLPGPRYDGVLPACDAPVALDRLTDRFREKEQRFWKSDLRIVAFTEIRENAFRPWADDTIPRRWCSGIVDVSDGKRRAVYYAIAEDTNMVGYSFGIEWCVVGLDRNWAYNPECRMARP